MPTINALLPTVFLSLFLLFTAPIDAQDGTPPSPLFRGEYELGFWKGAAFQVKHNKFWKSKLMTHLRTQHDGEFGLDRYLLQWETMYLPRGSKFAKNWEIGLGLRYIGAQRKTRLKHYFRVHLDLDYSTNIDRLELRYRLRFQLRQEFAKPRPDLIKYWTKDVRNLFQIGYNFKNWKLDPAIWGEIFLHDELGELSGFTNYRLGIKTSYKFSKHHKIGIRYFIERELKLYNPATTHIFGIFYKYKMNAKKRKKKKKKRD